MATVDYKSGDYRIAASSSQQFTFWWGTDEHELTQYFDVSIGVVFSPRIESYLPLVEEQRAYLLDTSEGTARQVLLLTLRNDNNFEVNFVANHIRIY